MTDLSLCGGKGLPDSFPVGKESLKYVLNESTNVDLPAAIPRALVPPLDTRKITMVAGIRRSGKTHVLYNTMRRLEARRIDRHQMIFPNFEDDRLMPLRSRDLDKIVPAHPGPCPDFAARSTLHRHLHFLEESYILFLLTVAGRSIRRQAMNPKKLYPVDWALGHPLVPQPLIDAGHRLETAVHLHTPSVRRPGTSGGTGG